MSILKILGIFLILAVVQPIGTVAANPAIIKELAARGDGVQPGVSGQVMTDIQELSPSAQVALIARLSDAQIRELLLAELANSSASGSGNAGIDRTMGMLGGVHANADRVRQNLTILAGQIQNLPTVLPFAVGKLTAGRSSNHLFLVTLAMVGMVVVGIILEWLFRRLAGGLPTRIAGNPTDALGTRLSIISLRAVVDVGALVVFLAGAGAVFLILYQGHEPTRLLVITFFVALLIVRASSVISNALFAPKIAAARLLSLDDDGAQYLHRCVLWFAGITAFGFLTCALMRLLGLDERLHQLLLHIVAAVVIASLVTMIWRGRRFVADLISGSSEGVEEIGRLRRVLADTWHFLAIAYVILVYLLAAVANLAGRPIGIGGAIGSLLVVAVVPLLDGALRQAMASRRAAVVGEEGMGERNQYGGVVVRAARIILVVLAVYLIARLWRLDVIGILPGDLGPAVSRFVVDIGLTLLIGYVLWELVKIAMQRYLASDGSTEQIERGTEGGGTGATRLQTMLPLIRRFLQITIISIVVMVILSEMGVDIGPLIAGAGIVGIAIGFGAQTLVRDVVSGLFFLLDDAFRLGEYIDIGDVKGTVEGINVRSLVLRHHRGPLHTVPYGEIKFLTNYSRDWAIMKLSFRLTYNTDINKVKKIFKTIGRDLLEHEELGEYFLEPFKSQGVMAMEDSAMIVRGKFMAKPGYQFQIRKEVYKRVQEAFEENGIEFAHRRVAVDLPPGLDPKSPEGKAVADAAAAAVASQPDDAKAPA